MGVGGVAQGSAGGTRAGPGRGPAGRGMDGVSQCIEGSLSVSVSPPVDAVALGGVRRVVAHVERAVNDGKDRDGRWQMMMAALEGGISLSKGAGPEHAIANTLGDRGLHHGTVVTLCMPAVLRPPEPHAGEKMRQPADAMGARNAANAVEALSRKV